LPIWSRIGVQRDDDLATRCRNSLLKSPDLPHPAVWQRGTGDHSCPMFAGNRCRVVGRFVIDDDHLNHTGCVTQRLKAFGNP
jgi:hypothetical protein